VSEAQSPSEHPPKRGVLQPGFLGLTLIQFLTALNDNILKSTLSFALAAGGIWGGLLGPGGQAWAAYGLTIPFILLSGFAGRLTDRFGMRLMVRGVKSLEVLVALLALLAFLKGSVVIGLAAMFLLGLQSSFFGPSKYGLIPALIRPRDLPKANGITSMATNVAVIVGMLAGGPIYEHWLGDPVRVDAVAPLVDQSSGEGAADDGASSLQISYISGGGPLREASAIEGQLLGTGFDRETTLVFAQPFPEGPWVSTLPQSVASQVAEASEGPSRSVELILTSAEPDLDSASVSKEVPQVTLPLVVDSSRSTDPTVALGPESPGVAWLPGLMVLIVAGLGLLALLPLPMVPPMSPQLVVFPKARSMTHRIVDALFADYWRSLVAMSKSPLLLLVIADAAFYLIAHIAIVLLPDYREVLGVSETLVSAMQGLLGLSIGTGCVLAGLLSGKRIRLGLAAAGVVCLGVCFGLCGLLPTASSAEGFLASRDGMMLYAVNCLALAIGGIGAGFYLVPLLALIQHLAPAAERGRFLGTWNASTFLPGLVGIAIFQMLRIIGVPSVRIWLVCAVFAMLLLPLLVLVVRSLQRHQLADGWSVPLSDAESGDPEDSLQEEPV
jgi:MFS family permease